ncbi:MULTISPECIES: HAD-IA family hydrolase [unclassified Streptomyces]|uniref:HAD family hydrolase n=1 Tax=unclassified Streptomyces TaxID=2593676 RepID=UPI00081E3FDA|nr:HAD-IA family hydrolase [Streptomyces sp. LcepLS]MYR28338.1 HAD-IA family hydrolase [Streptomyces sp. SID4945]SCF36666.1 haloacid dehalogenase superfamily, subfamily IA, variant 3 with third motif having DD or ED/beta-phosphoglucomutase family hydrolase [Streptomyces sp. LcepLS]
MTAPERRLAPVMTGIAAMVFDVDGVLTDSARVHAEAWKEAFDACLREHPPADTALDRPFDAADDYLRYVDGKPRADGAAAFLHARRVPIPDGSPSDAPGTDSVAAVAALKDGMFTRRIRQHGIEPFPGSVRLLKALRSAGIPMAAASSSHHARDVLEGAGLLDYFVTLVDGDESHRLGLAGKPDPALFLEAAGRLGVEPAHAAVAEDALAGVEAGRRGGFGLVVGVDRAHTTDTARDLREHGADLVVNDLADLLRAPGTDERAPGTDEHAPVTDDSAPGPDDRAPGQDDRAPATDDRAHRAPVTDDRAPGPDGKE